MFQLVGLHYEAFSPLFHLADEQLSDLNTVRCIADCDVGFPCRISLQDAAKGEELLLLHYVHHARRVEP